MSSTDASSETATKVINAARDDLFSDVVPDGTAFSDIRFTLQTGDGALLYVQLRGVRHGSAEVPARLGRGEEIDAGDYTFRTSTRIETACARLDWLNRGIFIGVAGRRPGGVIYETYLVA